MRKIENTYKEQSLLLLDILITGKTRNHKDREIDFSVSLFLNKKVADSIEKEWKSMGGDKKTIPLKEMKVLSSHLPAYEFMMINDYLRSNFGLSEFIFMHLKGINIQKCNWKLSMETD